MESLPGLFGELGGLNDFLSAVVILLIGSIQTILYGLDTMTLFRMNVNPDDSGDQRPSLQRARTKNKLSKHADLAEARS